LWYGALQVILQIAAAGALIYGTAIPSCSDNDMCDQGMFCWTGRHGFGTSGSCFYCGNDTPVRVIEMPDGTRLNDERVHDSTGTVLQLASVDEKLAFTGIWNMTLIRGLCMNWPDWSHDSKLDRMDDWSDTALVNWCDRCVHFETGHVDPLSLSRLAMANKLGMRFMDWLALLVTAVVIALSFVAELKDNILCAIAAKRGIARGLLSNRWEWALWAVAVARRYMFLPALLNCVPLLILLKGGDALSICFNAVALMFLLSVDDLMFAVGLNERTRAEVETKGRVELDDDDASRLTRTKNVHVGLVVMSVLLSVTLGGSFLPNTAGVMFPGYGWFAMGLGALDEEVQKGGGAKRIVLEMAKIAGLLGIGYVLNVTLMLLIFLGD
jgi:hypothetical protein